MTKLIHLELLACSVWPSSASANSSWQYATLASSLTPGGSGAPPASASSPARCHVSSATSTMNVLIRVAVGIGVGLEHAVRRSRR